MAVFKAAVEVQDGAGRSLGAGMAYVHLPRGADVAQPATGTVSLRRWEPGNVPPRQLRLDDGRLLAINVAADALSDCSRNRILRFQTAWPPRPDGEPRGPQP